MLLTLTVLGPGLGKRLAWLVFGGGTTIILLLISPLGDKVIEYLPFVGTVEASNVEYRSRLIDVSLIVFMQNPIVGDFYFFKNPIMEQMRQGAGIIDVVNNYLQIALPYGAIGLSLFVGIFLSALQGTQRTRRLSLQEPEIERLGRCLIGALVGMLVTIGTVSSIGAISLVYSLFLGICVSYIRVFVREK